MSDTNNNITITNEITYYKCEISRETGTEILEYTISQISDDSLVYDDNFYVMYDEVRQFINTNKQLYKHNNVVNADVKTSVRAKLSEFWNDERYKCVCIIFPYDGLTTYNKFYCNQLTELIKQYMDSLVNKN